MTDPKLTSTFQETIKDEQVVVKKAMPTDIAYLKALETTLSEWDSEYDDEDFYNL